MSMLRRVKDLLNNSILVRTVGSLSCVVGLLFYALSSSFKSLFGEWNPTKIVLYIILSSIISVFVLFAPKSRVSVVYKLKPHVQFLVLMLISLYAFLADRSTIGKPDTWSVASSDAFALTSLCLLRQIRNGFDVGLLIFFLGCVTAQLMKIHVIFILVAAGLCFPLVVPASYSESQSDNRDSSAEEHLEIRIDDANRMTACFRYPLLIFWFYFEKWLWRPIVATTEQFLWNLQERERQQRELQRQQLEQWEEQWELTGEEQWEQQQLQGEQQREWQQLQERLQQERRLRRLRQRVRRAVLAAAVGAAAVGAAAAVAAVAAAAAGAAVLAAAAAAVAA